ncbi:dipeptidase [Terricaulis sp.]|uniref:dipeptidase n=1 Tax=Terricaulis sp. TaxID=2768686 RepID=UPI002AC50DE2|nr:membrane dipeptidase [Terricaulis sp.]MDZ4691590.1 membrane dipeptidase [Terricaulis sp.]
MNRRDFALGASALAAAGAFAAPSFAQTNAISSRARSVFRRATVVDGNLGPPIYSDDLPLPQATLDLVRNTGVSAIKTSMGGFNSPFEDTLTEIAFYQRIIERHPDYFRQVRTAADIAAAKRAGQLGIIFSFESAACLEDKVDRIDLFRNLGVRVMQLSYNTSSPFGAGTMSAETDSLTDLGREAVARMNAQGVALDLSHSNAATTGAAIEASAKPVLITHAGCSAVHPHIRHKSDAQMRALAEKGGVFGIYTLFFLAPPPRQPNLDDYMAHMTHALNVCGEDHVGMGSDTLFTAMELSPEERAGWEAQTEQRRAAGVAAPEEDGRLPFTEGLNRPDRGLVVADALLDRGYPPRVVEKVLGGNFIRAFGDIWG